MNILEFLQKNLLILDGGMGTLLQAQGLQPGELPERWNITHPDVITNIHREYFDAGSHVVNANTFGANCLKYNEDELDILVRTALENARTAREQSTAPQPKWVALDIGPTGKLLAPYGDLPFEEAVAVFAKTVQLGVKYGADLIVIETMNDTYETKAALLAAKENSTLPVFVSNAYNEDGQLMTGAGPAAVVAMLEGLGADVIGINCSLGPRALRSVAKEYLRCASVPILFKPNAGLPKCINGCTAYDVSETEFAEEVAELMRNGVRVAGGCCGTTPSYIRALSDAVHTLSPVPLTQKSISCVSSYTHAVTFGDRPLLIGERINPTGKKRFKEALRAQDMDYLLKEGISQQEKGVHILDVNVGLPEIDETAMLTEAVCRLQTVTDLPLQIDTADTTAMASALRYYNGKALINSVNGKAESMATVFPLAKKYGGMIVALTLDENGIPDTADGRVAIAEKIIAEAACYGIGKHDLLFDPLALTISADQRAARETLRAVHRIRHELGCHVSLGISNVSFGLPHRDALNSTFFTLALGQGLSAAIMNPYSTDMMKAYHAFCALHGLDEQCAAYIAFAEQLPQTVTAAAPSVVPTADGDSALQHAIIKGLTDNAAAVTAQLLATTAPMDIIQKEIIPALDVVGIGFEHKTVYLPQLLMSAEAAKAAFEVIRETMPQTDAEKCPVVIATVKGDIHDIGKNIVKLLLQNYGFAVTDLGKDVPPDTVADAVITHHAPLAVLSALMTTTVPAMEETICLLRQRAPWCRVIVGGAVLTQDYADTIGADKYAKDAMEAVRYADEIYQLL